jgi:pimeloyl-ACP methyl ester carboxylesterase
VLNLPGQCVTTTCKQFLQGIKTQNAKLYSTCALLKVPLDYAEPSIGTLNIAIIKKPGPTPDAEEVLVNPGGPGGSSVAMVLSDHAAIEAKIGTEYSLVGIDPRGVNNSEPTSDCFVGYPFQTRNAFLSDAFGLADVTSEMSLKKQHQSALAYGKWCTGMYSVNGTASYANTLATAQDMLHYIELRAHDRGESSEEAKLRYYGISYGSILGSTFAALYPDRVGRMIIDGVLDMEDYYDGGWEAAIDDSDKAASYFFKHCFEAGPALCMFHQNATSWQELEQRYQALLTDLMASPVGLGDPTSNTSIILAKTQGILLSPYVLIWTDIISQMFTSTYLISPLHVYVMDLILVALQAQDVESLSVISEKSQFSTFRPLYDDRMARTLISCVDANGRSSRFADFQIYKKFVNYMYKGSRSGGLSVAAISGPICSKLNVRPPTSQTFDGIPRVRNTSSPILFISSIADPITPLSSAKKMRGLFPGSGLLVFKNSGVSPSVIKSQHRLPVVPTTVTSQY